MKLLILGGTNFIGPHLARAARRFDVTLFHRTAEPPHLAGDRDPDVGRGLEALFEGRWDAVIDVSGLVPRHVLASAQLLRNCHYVYISTVSAYASHAVAGQDETGALQVAEDPADETRESRYGVLKAGCEEAVREVFGDAACIVRPGLVAGPGDPTDRFTYWPARLAGPGPVLAPGDGKDPIQVVDVRDLTRWLLSLAEGKVSGTFNAVGPMTPMAELVKVSGKAPVRWVPTEYLLDEGVEPWTDLPVWVPREDPEDGGHNQLSNRRAVEAGLRFRELEDTAADTLDWFRGERRELKAGLSAEREARLLAGAP